MLSLPLPPGLPAISQRAGYRGNRLTGPRGRSGVAARCVSAPETRRPEHCAFLRAENMRMPLRKGPRDASRHTRPGVCRAPGVAQTLAIPSCVTPLSLGRLAGRRPDVANYIPSRYCKTHRVVAIVRVRLRLRDLYQVHRTAFPRDRPSRLNSQTGVSCVCVRIRAATKTLGAPKLIPVEDGCRLGVRRNQKD